MARPFSYPEVAALEVGGTFDFIESASVARSKIRAYAIRHNQRFSVTPLTGSFQGWVSVQRLPVTDVELPGVG